MKLDRRAVVASAACGTVLSTFPVAGLGQTPSRDDGLGDKDAADAWMQRWISSTLVADPSSRKAPNGALHMGRFKDPMYFLISTIGWDPNPSQVAQYKPVRVPVGFVTDLTSVPRLFWSLLRPDGAYSFAAIIHDYLYWEQYLSRETADEIFRFVMSDFGISDATTSSIYYAVRLAGGFAWDNNAAAKAKGEKRFLTKFPEIPTTTWSDWKNDSSVFR